LTLKSPRGKAVNMAAGTGDGRRMHYFADVILNTENPGTSEYIFNSDVFTSLHREALLYGA